MKFLVIGTGSIGKRHLRNLISIGIDPCNLSVVDTREDRRKEVVDLGINNVFPTLEASLKDDEYNAAFVCSPTNLHIKQGIELASRGVHIMMEKPLAHNLNGIKKFVELVNRNNVVVMMAYKFRFSSLTQKVKELIDSNSIGKILYARGEFSEYLPDWHPYEDYRSFYMAEKSRGGGSILDQCHIMDLVHYLLGGFDTVFAVNTKLSSLEINADDFAELIIKLNSGIIASIHTDIFGREHKKQLEIKGETGNIIWDFYANTVTLYESETNSSRIFNKFINDFNLAYIDELNHFIACCKNQKKPLASLEDGIETMELILSAERSHRTGKLEKVKV